MPQGKEHKPSEESRAQILALVGFGITQPEIAGYFGISEVTLRKHYSTEIMQGVVRTNVVVARSLFDNAKSGNVAAQIFWMKTRAGWRETIQLDHKIEPKTTIDVDRLTFEQQKALLAAMVDEEPEDEDRSD